MNEGYTVDERLRNLVDRAEGYFLKIGNQQRLPEGVLRWLEDLTRLRDLESCRAWRQRENRDGRFEPTEELGMPDVD